MAGLRLQATEGEIVTLEQGSSSTQDPNMILKVAAPIIAIGATWAVRKVMEKGYSGLTGNAPPRANDPDQKLTRVLVWATATAAAIAIVDVVISRTMHKGN
jgi:hypothetical protein